MTDSSLTDWIDALGRNQGVAMNTFTFTADHLPDAGKLRKQLQELYRQAPRACAQIAVNHIEMNFELGGFVDKTLRRWPKRRAMEAGGKRGLLIGRTHRLAHSLRVLSTSPTGFTVGTDVPYAAIHNSGGTIRVTPKMRGYFWAMCKQATGARALRKDGTLRATTKNRALNEEAEMWKRMALAKVLKVPKRQFIGPSQKLDELINQYFIDRLNAILPV